MGNFNAAYIPTGLYASGYFDNWNVGLAEISASAEVKNLITTNRTSLVDSQSGDEVVYECIFRPNTGIINSKLPLIPGCELKLSFDRAKSEFALISTTAESAISVDSVLKLKNLFLRARYYSSALLRNYFGSIDNQEIKYRYDECSCYLKNLPVGETNIRLANVIGGQTPSFIFCGVIESKALEGDFALSSTQFERNGVKEFDLSLNGYSCNGFPIINNNGSALSVYNKWLQSTNRYFNNKCGKQVSPMDFKRFHFLYSHKFEGEPTDQGWIGMDLKLDKPFADNYTLGKFIIICLNFI